MTTIDATRPDLDSPTPPTAEQERTELLRRAVEGIRAARAEADEARRAVTAPIAVVGMACRFPGGAVDADSFWALLTEGRSGITEVPADRWDVDAYYSTDPAAAGRSYARHGGFVDGVREFDADLFGIPPREAVSMDPQHRMVLEVSWEALEHAGMAPDGMRGTRTGVFVGMGGSDYERLNVAAGGVADLGGYAATGGSGNMAANRVSYGLGLEGPSLVVDTACSSSLVAVHLAGQALRLGECDTALVGGVNLLLSPESTVTLAKGKMLSPTGQCRTFDSGADGYVRGEGCGVVVLRPLDAALRDGQDVLAVIRGSAVNQDGASSGLTVPRGPAQQDVITRALDMAGVAAAEVDFVECHGTGTPLGDPIEIKALAATLGAGRATDRPLVVGSVKTNIGHLEAAAGIAGLIKTVLVVHHGTVPRHLNLVRPNPLVAWDDLRVSIPTAPVPLRAGERIAGTSSFGFGGTNAHVVLAAPPAPVATPARCPSVAPALVKIAGRDATALRAVATRLARHLRAGPGDPDIWAVAHAAGVGRADLAERSAVMARSVPELLAALDAVAAGDPAPPSTVLGRRAGADASVALVLPGSAADVAGVLSARHGTDLAVTRALDELIDVFGPVDVGPLRLLLDAGATDLDPRPAVFAMGLVLGRWWESIGVRPDLVVGHGVGAYAAAAVAGVMDAGDAARLVAAECAGQDPGTLLVATALGAAQAELVTDAPADVLRLGPASAEYWTARAARPRPAPDVEASVTGRPHTLITGPATEEIAEPDGFETAAARLWAAGGRLDWTRVNGSRPPTVPRLPGYPFQRRTYWTDAATVAVTGEERPARRTGWLPPTVLRTATGLTVAQTAVSLSTVPFLDEHRVHGRIVVPGVVFLELVLRAAAEVLGDEVALTDLDLQRPLVLADDESATLQVVLDPTVGDQAAVQVFSAADGGEWHRHMQCSVAAGGPETAVAAPPDATPGLDLTGDGEAFYRDAWHPDFRLGESFRVITRYGRRDGFAVGDIGEPPAHAAGLAAGIRPELLRLDAAVQLVGAARPGAAGPVHLGTGYERLVVHGSLDHPTLRGTAVLRHTDHAVGDLVLRAPDGTVAAELFGVVFRPVTPEALDRVSTRATTTGVTELDRTALAAADTAGREALLATHLATLLAAIRHSSVEEVPRDVPLVDLADSLMLAELEREAARTTGLRITLEVLFQSTGLDELAGTLVPEIVGPDSAPDRSATPRRPAPRSRRKSVDEMLALAELDPAITVRSGVTSDPPTATLLTGATGYVGAFLLDELLRRDDADVLCHVRAADEEQALTRITSNLRRYGINVADAVTRIRPVLGDLAEPRLGLSDDAFTALHGRIGSVLHCGGMVKWTYPYRGLAPANVDGTREVLRLATLGAPRPVHFISTVGVFSSVDYEPASVGEDEPLENSGPLVVGYAQSKWVAERMVRTAAERGLPVTIHRINTGWHSTTGAFNRMDHLMMILKGCIEAGLAPDTMAMPVQPAPIDVVARGVVELSSRAQPPGARTYHLVHDRPITWSSLFDLVEQHGYPMRRLPFDDWRTTITGRSSGTLALLGLAPFLEDTADDVRLPVSTTGETRRALDGTADCPSIDADLVGTLLRSFVAAGFVDPPSPS